MPYVIRSVDKPGASQLRSATRPAHLEYLTARKDKLLAAGALIDDDGRCCGHVDLGALGVADRWNSPYRRLWQAQDAGSR